MDSVIDGWLLSSDPQESCANLVFAYSTLIDLRGEIEIPSTQIGVEPSFLADFEYKMSKSKQTEYARTDRLKDFSSNVGERCSASDKQPEIYPLVPGVKEGLPVGVIFAI